jgi:hypothetical protein
VKRDYLAHPGYTKRVRWGVCVHEAAHALAFSTSCGVPATAVVYTGNSGGICSHPRIPDALLRNEMIALAAGEVGERYQWILASAAARAGWIASPLASCSRAGCVPRGRFKCIRVPRKLRVRQTDEKAIALYGRYAVEFCGLNVDAQAVWAAADDFVLRHLPEILALARKLYICGRVHIPAACAAG